MTLEIDTREQGPIVVLSLKGRLTFGEECQQLDERVRGLAEGGQGRILANIAELSYIDSSGVGELIACFTSLRKSGGAFKLTNPQERVLEIFKLVRLPEVIPLFDSEAEALASYE